MKRIFTVSLLAVALLSACAPIQRAEQQNARVSSEVDDARSRQSAARLANPAVFVHSGPRLLGAAAKRTSTADQWPPVLLDAFPYRSPAQTLEQVLSDLSARTGIQMTATDRVGQPGAAAAAPGLPGATAAPAAAAQTQSGIQLASIRSLRHDGSLARLLDQIASDADGFWRFEAGKVVFFRRETRTWQLAIPRAKRAVSEAISLGGQGAAATVSVSNSSTTDPYDALRATVEGVLGTRTGVGGAAAATGTGAATGAGATAGNLVGAAGNIVISRDFGLLTVTGTPPQLDKVAELVGVLNDRFSRNVQINVRVLNWTLNDAARLGVSVNAVDNVRRRLSLTGGGVPGTSTLTPSTLGLGYTSADGTKSVDLLLTAMAEYGEVSQVTSGDVRAVNGQPAPIQIANDIGYIASSTTTSVPNVGVQTTLTPGTVRVGFTGNFVPLLLGDGRIALDYSVSLSSATIQTLSSGGTNPVTIGTPNVNSQSLQQSTVVRDGESIVLMGFERQSADTGSVVGVNTAGQAGSRRKEMLVIVMEVSSGK